MCKDELIELIEPSEKTDLLFNEIKIIIEKVLSHTNINLIGSLAIPMLSKKEMDILIETDNVSTTQKILCKEGFSIGPIINQEGFCKNRNYDLLIELHIVPFEHVKIDKYFSFIKKLQKNILLIKKFEKFKMNFKGLTIIEYSKAKSQFLKENNLI